MNLLKSLFIFITCHFVFTGCAVYQSEARKKLEKEGLEFAAGGALAELSEQIPSGNCGSLKTLPDSVFNPETLQSRHTRNEYGIFILAENEKRMTLITLEKNIEIVHLCLFAYPTQQQQIQLLEEDFAWSRSQL